MSDPGGEWLFHYALVRFQPFPETEEFVNVGVVAFSTDPPQFQHQLRPSPRDRVLAFFPRLPGWRFDEELEALEREFRRVGELLAGDRGQHGLDLFLELVRPRETAMRFSHLRTIAAPEPYGIADLLFSRYVLGEYQGAPAFDRKPAAVSSQAG